MKSGEATNTKSYEPGYKAFIFWNLTKNSPVLRMGGISYIPKELDGEYTYDRHYEFLTGLLAKDGSDFQKALNYTRQKLILDFVNKRAVPPLSLNYNLNRGWFTIKTNFEMVADPDSGDIILKIQNENNTDVEAYRELTDAVVMNLYEQILYIDGNTGNVVSLSTVEGEPMYVQRSLADSIENLCKLFQISECSVGQFLDVLQRRTASHETYGFKFRLDDGKIKFIWAKPIYNELHKYIVAISDFSDMTV